MMTVSNRQFLLKNRPQGRVSESNFELVVSEAKPKAGQALVENLYLSLDPTNRIWMTDVEQYMPPVAIGEVMRGLGIGRVMESNSDLYKVDQLVSGPIGWQDYCLIDGQESWPFTVLPALAPDVPLTLFMGAAGMTGLTAYFGLLEVGQAKAGQTLLVSAAAGATGSVVGQIGKIKGMRVVGIAGGAEKCRLLTEYFGFDAAVDYKDADWKKQLADATPDGVDVSFENVGGEIMNAAITRLNMRARMVLCGLISSYNDDNDANARANLVPFLMKRASLQGFIVSDYFAKFAPATTDLVSWVLAGQIKTKETLVDGLKQAPEALNQLFDGNNVGKLLVKLKS